MVTPAAATGATAATTAAGAVLAGLALAGFVLPVYYLREATYLYVMAIAALGLSVSSGSTGLISLGHAAFIGTGAYAHALLLSAGWPWPLAFVGAMAAAAVLGWAAALPLLRLSGLNLVIATMSLAMIAEHVMGRWRSVTGGHDGMPVPDPVLGGLAFGGPRSLHAVCLCLLVLTLAGLHNLSRSGAGRAWVASRDAPVAAQTLGIDLYRTRRQAFVLSAGICGAAGALFAHLLQFITPEAFGLSLSLQLLLMVYVGGAGSLGGALIGAAVVSALPPLTSQIKVWLPSAWSHRPGLELFVYGALLSACVLLEPRGLIGCWDRLRERWRAHRRQP